MDIVLRDEIKERVRRGDPLEVIDHELIDARRWLDEDERAALWLYAWLGVEHRERELEGV